jgi:hypothetical protein
LMIIGMYSFLHFSLLAGTGLRAAWHSLCASGMQSCRKLTRDG